MDISQYNTRVLQEPRGMIRIITLVFAILAFATTSGFDTSTSFKMNCAVDSPTAVRKGVLYQKVDFQVEYPFKFDVVVTANRSCPDTEQTPAPPQTQTYKMEFSSSAQFFVATGVLSFLYSTACLVLYIFGTHYYESNPLIPVIDLAASGVLTIFWLAGACAWAAGVSDVKYYTSPSHLMGYLDFCKDSDPSNLRSCDEDSPGKWTALNISLIFGFANVFLWGASMWFVFKETSFHRKPDQMPGAPAPQDFGQYGDQMGAQQQMPPQTHFPQQRQFADGY